uniref:Uncharacterized protein n=2 Tax=Chenopodium quinoa TaxID=63459 RepID=A0A803LEN1_CHEQI
MEVTGENLTLLHKIRPPNLEDAGLEDCALPPDSIKEAFLKAASAVGSRAASVFAGDDEEINGGCVSDPWIEKHAPSDALVGVEPEKSPPGACAAEKGGALVGDGDAAADVVVVGEKNGEEVEDEVVIVGGKDGGEGGD